MIQIGDNPSCNNLSINSPGINHPEINNPSKNQPEASEQVEMPQPPPSVASPAFPSEMPMRQI